MAKMLVVDDDPAWRALYRMGFEADFEVFEAVDGLDALAALDRVRPDVIVLDLKMPHLDGMGFLRQMERRGLKVPVIVCSGTFTMTARRPSPASSRPRRARISATSGAPSRPRSHDRSSRTRPSRHVAQSKKPFGATEVLDLAASAPA